MKKSFLYFIVSITLLMSCKEKGELPIVETLEVTTIATDWATVSGQVTYDGGIKIISRGMCYGTEPQPDINANVAESGSSTGIFETKLINLSKNTTYYVRAFATNNMGIVYGAEKSFSTAPAVGNIGPSGGYIIYIDDNGGGLEAAPNDIPVLSQWGCCRENFAIPSTLDTRPEVGFGQHNTEIIIHYHDSIQFFTSPFPNCPGCYMEDNNGTVAAKFCTDALIGGQNDWFLPSTEELRLMYNELHLNSKGNFSNNWYWSSSDAKNESFATSIDFKTGSVNINSFKINGCKVRCVRKF
jgi:hypothetical protein